MKKAKKKSGCCNKADYFDRDDTDHVLSTVYRICYGNVL